MKKNIYLLTSVIIISFFSCSNKPGGNLALINVYPDSMLNDLSIKPLGLNLNFLMDGGRYSNPEHTVTEAVKKMNIKYLRYPGGEKSDLYLFSLPPYKSSNPKPTRTGGLEDYPGMFTENNDFVFDPLDFDEFIAVCRESGAEPVVVVAADYYLIDLKEGEKVTSKEKLIEHAAAWVNYSNIQKKYGVKYWMIGNESWNENNKNSTKEIYANDVIDFSKAMKAVDPSIFIIPNGESDVFFKTVIETAGEYVDRLCVSNYGVWHFPRGYESYRDTVQCLINPALIAIEAMNKYATPEQLEKWKLIVAEYGTIDWSGNWKGENDIGHAIVSFDMTGQLLQQPQIEFSCYWNTRWIENETNAPDHDVLDKNGNILPTGHALSIWANFIGNKIVKTGSPEHLVSFSTVNLEKGQLFVYVINKSSKVETAKIKVDRYKIVKMNQSWHYYGQFPEDKSPIWEQTITKPAHKAVKLAGYSISVFEYQISTEI